jgi:putative effector of murein hydrolase
MINFVELWVYLSGSPLLWLTATLVVYIAADAISVAFRRHPLANPVLMAVAFLSVILLATGTQFPTYFAGAQFVHFLLGPATVALAIPLVRYLPEVRRTLVPMLTALIVGSVTAIASAVLLAKLFGLDRGAMLALAPKSSTAAIAMGIAEKTGADPSLTAVLVILTGISGAIIVTPLMNVLRLKNYAARVCGRPNFAWHWHCKSVPGGSFSRNVCWNRAWSQWIADRSAGAAAVALATGLIIARPEVPFKSASRPASAVDLGQNFISRIVLSV